MNARCKAGDLAIIANDTPLCAANIGRLVKVRGPSVIDSQGFLTWLITPVDQREPYLVEAPGGRVTCMKPGEDSIEHPDAWLQPVFGTLREASSGGQEEVAA